MSRANKTTPEAVCPIEVDEKFEFQASGNFYGGRNPSEQETTAAKAASEQEQVPDDRSPMNNPTRLRPVLKN
ncbi:hypothetical protein DKP76_18475 [Falsochrobactrum shanghaiense]|uniref:Uncharacterized protein n=1 Tax=Falsochrobactrum shanghaiense TaxID=2201899 RepID=A0A316J4K1_9HYPH|nr:hypothetical protein [Falsochrobactrum shanghaiense]PWL16261.1 hypothetical protein DKP76_18475 [Falsochrobactrum shanghaiense]